MCPHHYGDNFHEYNNSDNHNDNNDCNYYNSRPMWGATRST